MEYSPRELITVGIVIIAVLAVTVAMLSLTIVYLAVKYRKNSSPDMEHDPISRIVTHEDAARTYKSHFAFNERGTGADFPERPFMRTTRSG